MSYEQFSLCIHDATNIIFISFISAMDKSLIKNSANKIQTGLLISTFLMIAVGTLGCGNKGPLTQAVEDLPVQKKQIKE